MTAMNSERLGLVLTRGSWSGRSGRDALDTALAAASLDWSVDLFLCGDGIAQLLTDQNGAAAALPAAHKAWAMLPVLAPTRFFADPELLAAWSARSAQFVVEIEPLATSEWSQRQGKCRHVLVL